jgi:hypothetical protein
MTSAMNVKHIFHNLNDATSVRRQYKVKLNHSPQFFLRNQRFNLIKWYIPVITTQAMECSCLDTVNCNDANNFLPVQLTFHKVGRQTTTSRLIYHRVDS